MLRKIIEINEDKCTGCGLCVTACHEGAIALVDGKAKLVRDSYCDGLGDCLPACPEDAISFVVREAEPYDEASVIAAQMARAKAESHASMPSGGCPGSMAKSIARNDEGASAPSGKVPSCLSQWPCQIKLVPPNAPYLDGCDLLIAADCCAFAYGDFHRDFIDGRVCLVGCPKLDGVDYSEKLSAIVSGNDVRSITVARMEVPCCGGIEHAARTAGDIKGIPVEVKTISTDGRIL